MKKSVCFLMVLLLLAGGITWAQDDSAPAPAPVVEAVTPADAEVAVETPEVVAETEGVGIAKAAGANVLLLIIEIGGAVIVILLVGVTYKILGKVGIEKSQRMDELITGWAHKAVDAAEAWGRKNKKSGNEKMDKAVEFIDALADSTGAKRAAKKKIGVLAEAYLEEKKLWGPGKKGRA